MIIRRIVPGETRVGWVGTGVMGASMCGHLIDKGFSATVYNRTQSKTAKGGFVVPGHDIRITERFPQVKDRIYRIA